MAFIRPHIPMLIGAVIVVLLQVMVAPYLTIGYAMVNLIMGYVIIMAIFRAEKQGYIMPFVLGLIYDLLSSGCVGAMALVCVVLTFAISRIYLLLSNDTHFIAIALIVAGCFLGEFAYGCLVIVCGLDVNLLEALLYRVLPCGLYDTVVALIAYFLMARFLYGAAGSSKQEPLQVIR